MGLATESAAWMSAYMQPWSILQDWNAFWSKQWKIWFDTVVSTPNPWLPALAAGRAGQPAAIDFFLPWLPRIEALVTPLESCGERDAVRVMLRAALPHLGPIEQTEWLNVDAAVSRTGGSAASSRLISAETPETPAPLPMLEAAAASPEPASKPAAAPKRRVRKPAATTKAKPGKTPSGE